jgi:two-component system, chemotaxis family, CheB/CheR fusion protein
LLDEEGMKQGMKRERKSRRPRVLLVEDATDIRDVFQMLLEAEGAQVVATGSGVEAARLTAREEFDVLVTDLGLPDIPGEMVIRQTVRNARRRPRIVVVTGYDEPFTTRARAAGADVILTKPVMWSTLVDELTLDRVAA